MTTGAWLDGYDADLLVDNFRIQSEVDDDEGLTTHRKIVSDPSRGIRKGEQIERWSRVRRIGIGGFGVVFLERLEKEKPEKLRAVKQLRKYYHSNEGHDFLRELMHMAYFSKDRACFPEFQGWFEDKHHIYLAMEYFEHGDLVKCVSSPLPESEARHITVQVVEALATLHAKQITHRDLKPENVFVFRKGPGWWVKLGDFGISKRVRNNDTALYTRYLGPYIAPEVNEFIDLEGESATSYTDAVDIWSLGCLVHWLLTKQTPFHVPGSISRYCSGKIGLPIDLVKDYLSESGQDFLRSCLTVRASNRPRAKEAMSLPWLLETSSTAPGATESPSNRTDIDVAAEGDRQDSEKRVITSIDLSRKDAVGHGGTKSGAVEEPAEPSDPVTRILIEDVDKGSTPAASPKLTAVGNNTIPSPSDLAADAAKLSLSPVLKDTASNISVGSTDANLQGSDTVDLPTIKFTPYLDASAKPSLVFPVMSRMLDKPTSIIRIGRYSDRHANLEHNPKEPSDGAVSFKSKVVSRRHCEIYHSDGLWWVEDVGSSSGTFLDGVRLSNPNVRSSPYFIANGAKLQLGIDFRGGEEYIFRRVCIVLSCSTTAVSASLVNPSASSSQLVPVASSDVGDDESALESSVVGPRSSSLRLATSSTMKDLDLAKALSLLEQRGLPANSGAALRWAVEHDYIDVVRLLFNSQAQKDADIKDVFDLRRINSLDDGSRLCALHVAIQGNHTEIIKVLLDSGADIEVPGGSDHMTPLHMAASAGAAHIVGMLLDRGAKTETPCKDNLTPLHIAAREGHVEVLRLLISWGAEVNATTKFRVTALLYAILGKHISLVRYLVGKGADISAADMSGRTPLIAAISSESAGLVQLLLDWGAPPNQEDKTGLTPLISAARAGQRQMVIDLAAAGAKLDHTDDAGRTALTHAKELGRRDVVSQLRSLSSKDSNSGSGLGERLRSVFNKK